MSMRRSFAARRLLSAELRDSTARSLVAPIPSYAAVGDRRRRRATQPTPRATPATGSRSAAQADSGTPVPGEAGIYASTHCRSTPNGELLVLQFVPAGIGIVVLVPYCQVTP